MKHPTKISGFEGTPKELAEAIGKTRYDTTWRFDIARAEEYRRQAREDEKAGHPQLARRLDNYAELLEKAAQEMAQIYRLCRDKPGMQD
jgi:hypothetical protein